jgi:pimeloyl-ACP methyl ester carboxylesterase
VDQRRISLLGHSFGGSVATAAAQEDARIHTVIALGPTRRVEERVVGPQARDRLLWRTRFAVHRGLPEVPPETFIGELMRALALEYHASSWRRPGHPPLLLIDGEREPLADRRFLETLARQLAPPAAYRTVPDADHYLNSASWGRWVCYDRRAVETCTTWIVEWVQNHVVAGVRA